MVAVGGGAIQVHAADVLVAGGEQGVEPHDLKAPCVLVDVQGVLVAQGEFCALPSLESKF